jgi:hypothetical protein
MRFSYRPTPVVRTFFPCRIFYHLMSSSIRPPAFRSEMCRSGTWGFPYLGGVNDSPSETPGISCEVSTPNIRYPRAKAYPRSRSWEVLQVVHSVKTPGFNVIIFSLTLCYNAWCSLPESNDASHQSVGLWTLLVYSKPMPVPSSSRTLDSRLRLLGSHHYRRWYSHRTIVMQVRAYDDFY